MNEGNIWQATIQVCRAIPSLIATYVMVTVVVAEGAYIADSSSASVVPQLLITMFLAIPAHLLILTPTEPKSAITRISKILWRFTWRFLILGFASLAPVYGAVYLALDYGISLEGSRVVALSISLLSACTVFGLWGTILPAATVDANSSFSVATKRGKNTFGYAFSRLLLAFGFLSALQLFIPVVLISGLEHILKIPSIDEINFIDLPISALGALIGAFQVIMISVILSRAFLAAHVSTEYAERETA